MTRFHFDRPTEGILRVNGFAGHGRAGGRLQRLRQELVRHSGRCRGDDHADKRRRASRPAVAWVSVCAI